MNIENPPITQVQEAFLKLEDSLDDLSGLDTMLGGWMALQSAAKMLELAAYSLAGSQSSMRVARLILMASELERMLEDAKPPILRLGRA